MPYKLEVKWSDDIQVVADDSGNRQIALQGTITGQRSSIVKVSPKMSGVHALTFVPVNPKFPASVYVNRELVGVAYSTIVPASEWSDIDNKLVDVNVAHVSISPGSNWIRSLAASKGVTL